MVFTYSSTYKLYSVTGGFIKEGISTSSTRIVDSNNENIFTLAVTGEIRAGNKYQFTLANTDVDYHDTNYSIPVLEDKSQVTLTINTVV